MANTDVVVPQQDAIRVYVNESGGITIEQDGYGGDSSLVWLDHRHAEVLCRAIRAAAKEARDA